MNLRHWMYTFAAAAVLLMGSSSGYAQDTRVFELRVYHTYPGKLDDLIKRFRDHTTTIFEKHGMHNIGYWTPVEGPGKDATLYYIISHASREQARQNWKEFGADPEWKQVQTESEKNGKLVEKVDSTFMAPTDFSAIK